MGPRQGIGEVEGKGVVRGPGSAWCRAVFGVRHGGIRRAFSDDERKMIARGMVEHLRVWQEMIASEINESQVALHGVINSIAP